MNDSTLAPRAAVRPLALKTQGLLKAGIALLLFAATLVRLSPLFDIPQRLFWQFMSEDGYLMQTIARNMAVGLGMSTAQGTMPTNGVQPLATLIFAGLHALVGGERVGAIALVTVWSTAVAAAAAWLLRLVLRRLLPEVGWASLVATLGATLWFASPLITSHSMNGLETGLYYFFILLTLVAYLRWTESPSTALRLPQRLALGLLLGLTFLARNDAVFFISALLISHFALGGPVAGGGWWRRGWDGVVASVVSLLVALPWLVYNQRHFGSIVPMSGKAESHAAALGENLRLIPANLIESASLLIHLPRSLEGQMPVVAVAMLLLLALSVVVWQLMARRTLATRRFALTALLFTAMVVGYYGVFFGAAWFVTRYVSALSPLLWPLSFGALCFGLSVRWRPRFAAMAGTGLALALVMFVGVDVRTYAKGSSHQHRQVVDWVQTHLPETEWVGAVQTGTLGYFHDRTINLDGKVNLRALEASIRQHQVQSYVLDQTPLNYIVDWSGIAGWLNEPLEPRFGQAFSLVLKDDALNLAVLRRNQPIPAR